MTALQKQQPRGELYCVANQTNFAGDRFKAAEKVLSWLIERDIIKRETDIVRYQQNGHRFSEGIKQAVTGAAPDTDSIYAGLEYNTERSLYCFHPTFDYILCPHCETDLESCETHENIFLNTLEQWENHNGAGFVRCPGCHEQAAFHEFRYGIKCAFGDLAFIFFDCQGLTEEFQAEFEQILGCRVSLIRKG